MTSAITRRSLVQTLAIAVCAAAIGVGAGVVQVVARASSEPTDAPSQLPATSFAVLVPQYLPTGAKLARTSALTKDGYSSVDLHYTLADGSRLHVWETDQPDSLLGHKAPSLISGTRRAGNLAVWTESSALNGRLMALHARVNGVVVMVDGERERIAADELRRIADSVR